MILVKTNMRLFSIRLIRLYIKTLTRDCVYIRLRLFSPGFIFFGFPSRFAPENQSNINKYAYLPFGIGPRQCLGMRLALLELRLTLITLLQKYKMVRSTKLVVIRPSRIFHLGIL